MWSDASIAAPAPAFSGTKFVVPDDMKVGGFEFAITNWNGTDGNMKYQACGMRVFDGNYSVIKVASTQAKDPEHETLRFRVHQHEQIVSARVDIDSADVPVNIQFITFNTEKFDHHLQQAESSEVD